MRGLKLQGTPVHSALFRRIFYRCVDWNIIAPSCLILVLSHLLQMRGLKLLLYLNSFQGDSRIFYRCVDWNFRSGKNFCVRNVASFTDAWIETRKIKGCWNFQSRIFYRCVDWNFYCQSERYVIGVASFTDAWIETKHDNERTVGFESHLLQMRGLKQKRTCWKGWIHWSHLLQMLGLKLWDLYRIRTAKEFASFTDAWIETSAKRTLWK